MGDIVILETAQHMGDGVTFADIGQKLVAKALALAGAFDQPRDIDKGHAGRDDLFGTCNRGQFVQPRIRYGDITDIGFNRAEREIRGLCGGGFRQRVEQRRFADIRQTNNPHLETHARLSFDLCALLGGAGV